jgi:hypothetical protein
MNIEKISQVIVVMWWSTILSKVTLFLQKQILMEGTMLSCSIGKLAAPVTAASK